MKKIPIGSLFVDTKDDAPQSAETNRGAQPWWNQKHTRVGNNALSISIRFLIIIPRAIYSRNRRLPARGRPHNIAGWPGPVLEPSIRATGGCLRAIGPVHAAPARIR